MLIKLVIIAWIIFWFMYAIIGGYKSKMTEANLMVYTILTTLFFGALPAFIFLLLYNFFIRV